MKLLKTKGKKKKRVSDKHRKYIHDFLGQQQQNYDGLFNTNYDAKRQQNNGFKMLKENYCQPRITYTRKIVFKNLRLNSGIFKQTQ